MIKFKSNFSYVIFLSLLCHFFILSVFNLSIQKRFQSKSPYFISLGSIISTDEFASIDHLNKNLSYQLGNLSLPPRKTVGSVSKTNHLNKPVYSTPDNIKNKTSPKITFLTVNDSINKTKNTIQDTELDTEPYKPLQLP